MGDQPAGSGHGAEYEDVQAIKRGEVDLIPIEDALGPPNGQRVFCAHADENGEGAHWKAGGDPCPPKTFDPTDDPSRPWLTSAEVEALPDGDYYLEERTKITQADDGTLSFVTMYRVAK